MGLAVELGCVVQQYIEPEVINTTSRAKQNPIQQKREKGHGFENCKIKVQIRKRGCR